jgi:hypothetical protein
MQTPRIDDPAALAEVQDAFARYERALVANDREALIDFFFAAPTTVRYGIDDEQYGSVARRPSRHHRAHCVGRSSPPSAPISRWPTPSSCPTARRWWVDSPRRGSAPTTVGRS